MQWVKRYVFTDTGASTAEFLSAKFAKQHNLSMLKLVYLCKLQLADDNLVSIVTHCAQLHFWLRNHYDKL